MFLRSSELSWLAKHFGIEGTRELVARKYYGDLQLLPIPACPLLEGLIMNFVTDCLYLRRRAPVTIRSPLPSTDWQRWLHAFWARLGLPPTRLLQRKHRPPLQAWTTRSGGSTMSFTYRCGSRTPPIRGGCTRCTRTLRKCYKIYENVIDFEDGNEEEYKVIFTKWKVFGTARFLQRSQKPATCRPEICLPDAKSTWEPAVTVQHLRKLSSTFLDQPIATSPPIDPQWLDLQRLGRAALNKSAAGQLRWLDPRWLDLRWSRSTMARPPTARPRTTTKVRPAIYQRHQ